MYGIGILPLGGYVKMLGQDDDPAHIAEQMQKSQVDCAQRRRRAKSPGPNGEKYYVDRRSYLAKSVPQRMAIISAGVIMNVIFAFIFAVIAYGMGVPYLAVHRVGNDARLAGVAGRHRAGRRDRAESANAKDPTFMQLKGGVTLGDLEKGIPVRRAPRGGRQGSADRRSSRGKRAGQLATIGVIALESLNLRQYEDEADRRRDGRFAGGAARCLSLHRPMPCRRMKRKLAKRRRDRPASATSR